VNILKKYISTIFGLALFLPLPAMAQQAGIPDAGELEIALQKLNVLGSVLYVGAHPDDENTAILAYLSKGRKYRTAYFRHARRGRPEPDRPGTGSGDRPHSNPGAHGRPPDRRRRTILHAGRRFRVLETAEETLEFWGRKKRLATSSGDPKIPPGRHHEPFFGPASRWHGHHMATALLVKEAFAAAADPGKFPEQLKYVSVWKPRRLLWNIWRPSQDEAKNLLRVDTGEYNPC